MPIQKKGKAPKDLGSYRPITMLANLGKVMECMVNRRLALWLESRSVISQVQAGFRRGRSMVYQCLRMSQRIRDGFQLKPPARNLMVLYKYRCAFHTVWRIGLLLKMTRMGIPATIVRCIQFWMVNRIVRVKIGYTTGRPRVYREGQPQGAVLSPTISWMNSFRAHSSLPW